MRRESEAVGVLLLSALLAGCGGLSADEQHGTAVAISRATASVVHATASAAAQATSAAHQRATATAQANTQQTDSAAAKQ